MDLLYTFAWVLVVTVASVTGFLLACLILAILVAALLYVVGLMCSALRLSFQLVPLKPEHAKFIEDFLSLKRI